MAKGDEPKTYNVALDGRDVPPEMVKYHGMDRIVLLVEDEADKLKTLDDLAQAAFRSTPKVGICAVNSTNTALAELSKYCQGSPNAQIRAVLDYNMSKNQVGEKRPTEGLFYEGDFARFLGNGGIVTFYSGYAKDIFKSPELMTLQGRYTNVAFFVAEKGDIVQPRDLINVMKFPPEKIPQLRELSIKYGHDLNQVMAQVRAQRR
ncbi:MAG: hypothetical protein AABY26_04580 [Nanoarchaeota archaeon]